MPRRSAAVIAKRAQSASQAAQGGAGTGTAVTSTVTSITVEAQSSEVKPPDPSKQQTPSIAPAAPAGQLPSSPPSPRPRASKRARSTASIPDNTVETLWSSKEENVYDVLALEKQILFSTDQDGRIYGLAPDRRVTLVTQTNEGETVRLLPSEHSVLAATGNMGRIFRLGDGPGASGSYEAPVHDAGTASRWGSLSWRADSPAGAADPVPHPRRQFRQARPHLERMERAAHRLRRQPHHQPQRALHPVEGGDDRRRRRTPSLNDVTLAYLPQNTPPVLKSINVVTAGRSHRAGQGRHLRRSGRLQRDRQRHRLLRLRHADPDPEPRRRAADHHHLDRPRIPTATAWSTPSISAARTRPSGSCCAPTCTKIP